MLIIIQEKNNGFIFVNNQKIITYNESILNQNVK